MRKYHVPITPTGIPCLWLKADSESEAWANLTQDSQHEHISKTCGFTIEIMELEHD